MPRDIQTDGKDISTILDEMKAGGDAKKNKFISFSSPKQFNSLLDVMKESDETEALLEAFQAGNKKDNIANETINSILDTVNTLISKTKDEAKLAVLNKQKEKLESQIKGGSKNRVGLRFVMKFLLATNKNKAVSALADDIVV